MLSNAQWNALVEATKYLEDYMGKEYEINGRKVVFTNYTLSGQMFYEDLETKERGFIWDRDFMKIKR